MAVAPAEPAGAAPLGHLTEAGHVMVLLLEFLNSSKKDKSSSAEPMTRSQYTQLSPSFI